MKRNVDPIHGVAVLLFLSGAASLAYQVVWTRILHYAFGNTEAAAATVLSVFMGGLALGGWLGGRIAPRTSNPLRLYGFLEITIAIYALLSTPLLYRLDVLYTLTGPDPSPWVMTLLRFAAGAAVMLVPTTAMGMTLPVVVQGVVRTGEEGRGVSILYFVNTLGAVAGTFLSGFVTIPALGLDGTVLVAVATGVLVGVGAIFASRYWKVPEQPGDVEGTGSSHASSEGHGWELDVALLLAWGGGFVSLMNEVLWFRLYAILLDGTIYGFSGMLASYLMGLALGSLWIAPRLDRGDAWEKYVRLQAGAAVGALLTIVFLPMIPWIVQGLLDEGMRGATTVFPMKVLLSFITLLVPTFFYGASFPVVVRLALGARRASESVGEVYAWNTVGCIVGAVFTAMYLIPEVRDTGRLLLWAAAGSVLLSAIAALVVLARDRARDFVSRAKILAYPALALVALGPRPDVNVLRLVESRYAVENYDGTLAGRVEGIRSSENDSRGLVFYAEGRSTIVTVNRKDSGGLRLRNSGLNESYQSPQEPRYAEELVYLAVLPYVLAKEPRRALLIGLGGGGTLDTLTRMDGLTSIDVCELEEQVVRASRFMFGNRAHPLDDPRVHLRIDDGRNALVRFARSKPHSFDIIVSQPSHPWLSGAANLYTYEHFRTVAANLTEGGVFCQWMNLFRMNGKAAAAIVAAFVRAFPHVQMYQVDENSVFLVGSNSPLLIDTSRIEGRLSGTRASKVASLYGISSPRIMEMYAIGGRDMAELASGEIPNSDRRPIVETVLPWVGHHAMFNIEQWVEAKGLHYGVVPEILAPDPHGALASYVQWLGYRVDPWQADGEDEIRTGMRRLEGLLEVVARHGVPPWLATSVAKTRLRAWDVGGALDVLKDPGDPVHALASYMMDSPAVLAHLRDTDAEARWLAVAWALAHGMDVELPGAECPSSGLARRACLEARVRDALRRGRGMHGALASWVSEEGVDRGLGIEVLRRIAVAEPAAFVDALRLWKEMDSTAARISSALERLAGAGVLEGALWAARFYVTRGVDVTGAAQKVYEAAMDEGRRELARQALWVYALSDGCDDGWLSDRTREAGAGPAGCVSGK